MVKISRKKKAPVVKYLIGANAKKDKCKVKTKDLCDKYLSSWAGYDSGASKFNFDDALIREEVFATEFKKSQNNKCCYCQKDLDPPVVEHYRPKSYVQQKLKGKVYYPGYYWLAYEWSNLLYACTGCNTSYKGNLFPIYNQSQRARNHHNNIAVERPIIINPLIEDPSVFIYFIKEKIKSKDLANRGLKNIKILGLDRTALTDERREYLNDIEETRKAFLFAKGSAKENEAKRMWKKYILEKKRKHSKFSAMVNDNYKSANW
jgi:uncharacterized protein (TIGR02646 family)